MAVDLRSLLSLAGSLWFLDSGHPPASRWGAADGVMVWWVASLSRRLRSQERLPVALTKTIDPPPGGTRAQHTATAAGVLLLSLAYDLYPSCKLLCTGAVPIVRCVLCEPGPLPFSLDPFFLCSLLLPHASSSTHLFPLRSSRSHFFLPSPALPSHRPILRDPSRPEFRKGIATSGALQSLGSITCTPCSAARCGVDGACTHSGVFETVKQSKLGSVSPVGRDLWPLTMANGNPLSLCPPLPHRPRLTNGPRSADHSSLPSSNFPSK